MRSVHPFARQKSFDPETLQIMGVALDCAWYELMVSDSALTASFRAEHTREALCLCIIAKAQLGERDVTRLRDYAVAHVKEHLELAPCNERIQSADQFALERGRAVASDGDYCRVKADQCRHLAKAVHPDDVKVRLLKLEQSWLENAAEADALALRYAVRAQAQIGAAIKPPAAC